MCGMFSNCISLTNLNLSNFNTKNVHNMNGMFSGCNSLFELNISNFNSEKVTDMRNMFAKNKIDCKYICNDEKIQNEINNK
jgi:surface protein